MQKSNEAEEYSMESVLQLMKQEEYGIHISLLDNGVDERTGNGKMSIVVESDLDAQMVQRIMWGLLEQYEEAGLD